MANTIIEDKKLKSIIRWEVIAVMRELLRDPDFGLELQDWVKQRLRKKPKKLIPFEEILKKHKNN